MQVLGGMGQQVAVLMNGAARPWQALTPEGGEGRLTRPGAPSQSPAPGAIDRGYPTPQGTVARPQCSPLPLLLMTSKTFCPSRRTPTAANTEVLVAVLSNRVLMTVPSEMRRTPPSSAGLRWRQGSQFTFTLR